MRSIDPEDGVESDAERTDFDETVRKPVFVLCAARTGSTLLRKLVDEHPDLYSPPETNFAQSVAAICQLYETLSGPTRAVTQEARDACYQLTDASLARKARLLGKRRWCDKSLSTVGFASLMRDVFPEAQFICLYRDCFDFLASAMESSPWGYAGYGFEPYVRDTPTNFVAGLSRYWIDRVDAGLSFEAEHPSQCLHLRYEDLVLDFAATMQQIWGFLGVAHYSGDARATWTGDGPHVPGPGDHKVMWTREITNISIGRGWTVPLALIPPVLKERIEALHEQLGYRSDPHERFRAPEQGEQQPPDSELKSAVISYLETRFRRSLPVDAAELVHLRIPGFDQSWLLDMSCSALEPLSDSRDVAEMPVIVVAPESLLLMVMGAVNPATALRDGKLQVLAPSRSSDEKLYDESSLDTLLRHFIEAVAPGNQDEHPVRALRQTEEMVV